MPKDSQAKFTAATKNEIRKKYKNRCAICHQKLTNSASECAHLLDSAGTSGAQQLAVAVDLGIISPDYRRSSAENGMVQCPNCHSLFTSEHIALSPSPEILKYVFEYLWGTDTAKLKPLHEVFRLLNDAAVLGVDVDLPNVNAILPFLNLYTLVTLRPRELNGASITAWHRPHLSTLNDAGTQFVNAPSKWQPNTPGVVRIFDVLSIVDTDTHATHTDIYVLPLSPKNTEFSHRRYWRVPVRPEVVLAILMERIRPVTAEDAAGCEEIDHAHLIYCILRINMVGGGLSAIHDRVKKTDHDRKRGHEECDDDEQPPPYGMSLRSSGIRSSSTTKKSKVKSGPKVKIVKASRLGPHPRKIQRLKI